MIPLFKKYLHKLRAFFLSPVLTKEHTIKPNQVEQVMLSVKYKELYNSGFPKFEFKDIGFQIYSQCEEDGILLYIFSIIGTTNKKCVEICLGDVLESNTTNLILNHRWVGLLFDGSSENIKKSNNFYKNNQNTYLWPPKSICKWITKGNINSIILENDFHGEIDFLSIDIDGNDYWIWKEISCISPRVVIVEYNHLWAYEKSVTVPYADNFKAEFSEYGSDYAGASLMAFIKLAKEKGYLYIGSNEISTNAFFLRNDIQNKWLPARDPSAFFSHPRAVFGMTKRFDSIKEKPWENV